TGVQTCALPISRQGPSHRTTSRRPAACCSRHDTSQRPEGTGASFATSDHGMSAAATRLAGRSGGRSRSSPATASRTRSRSHPATNHPRSPGAQVSALRTSTPRPSIQGRSRPSAPAVPSASRSSTDTCTGPSGAGRPARWRSRWSRPWWTLTATAPAAPTALRARASAWSTSGTPPTGHSGLGRARLSGRRRRPAPAASTTAQTSAGLSSDRWGMIAAMATIVQGIQGLRELAGTHLGYSDYIEVTQEQVDQFAEATGDHQWIHVDVERARKESPFGGPIAHGYLTLSLGPRLVPQVLRVEGIKMGVNYGC